MNDSNQTSHFVNSTNVYIDIVDPPTWSVNVFIAVNIVIMVLAVTGNGVILVVEQFNKQKTSTDWLVTFMSVNDLVLAGVNVPIYILMYNGSWTSIGSSFLCSMMLYIQETLSYSSTLLLTVTALDRYIKTCHPHATGITSRRSMFICIGVTLFTVVFSAPIPFYARFDEERKCKYVFPDGVRTVLTIITVVFVQGTFVVMFLIVIVCYCKIAYTIRTRINALGDVHVTSPRAASSSQTLVQRLSFLTNRVTPLPPHYTEPDTHLSSVSEKIVEFGMEMETRFPNNRPNHPPQLLITEESVEEETKMNCDNHTVSRPVVPSNETADDVSKGTRQHRIIPVQNQRSLREAQVNKTTAIMFAVTMVFIMSWVPPWVVAVLWPAGAITTARENIAMLFCRRSFMVNTCTNPLFYIGMSSAFRHMTKQTMTKLWHRLQTAIGYNI